MPMSETGQTRLLLADWRRRVASLYDRVRSESDPQEAHARWREGRDALFRDHPCSPLAPDDPLRGSGLPYWPYDAALRFELPMVPAAGAESRSVDTGADGVTELELIGSVELPEPLGGMLGVWWLHQYAGGLFLPLRDGTAGGETYGAGRYLLDTAKGADLGGTDARVVVDLNFAYHPSCRYDPDWTCPLAPAQNTIAARVEAGERLTT